MNSNRSVLGGTIFVVVSAIAGGAMAASETVKAHAGAISPDALKWGPAPPSLPKGAQAAVLAGDPGKPGLWTLRLKLPAGYKIPAHQHPTFEAATLISGTFNVGMGDKLDEAKADKLTAGSFIYLPANMNHFAFATTESVVQINSEGPFTISYVNPADDPRKTQ